MMVTRIAREKALPFEPLVPNEETVAAMREARSSKLPRFEDADALMKQCERLNAPRTSVCLNNRPEEDHRRIKGQIQSMRGFEEHVGADGSYRMHDELRISFAADPVKTSTFDYPPPSISPSRPHCDALHASRTISRIQPERCIANDTKRDRTTSRPSVQ
jgi:hypothetical protein